MLFGKHINKYYRKYWYHFLALIFFDIAVDIIQLFIPKITGSVVQAMTYDKETFMTGYLTNINVNGANLKVPFYCANFTMTLISVTVIALLIFFGRMGWRLASSRIGGRIEHDLRLEMYKNIQKLPLSYYSDKKVGGLLSYFTADLQSIKQLFNEGLIFLIDLTVLGSLSFIYMMMYSWRLGLICFIPLLLFIILGGIVGKEETKRSKEAGDAFEYLSDFTEENLQGFSVIKAFRKEKTKESKFSFHAAFAREKNIRFANFSSLLDGGINIIITIMYALLLFFGAYSLVNTNPVLLGNIHDTGEFLTFAGYADSLIWPMIAGGLLINEVSNAKASYIRISKILEEKEDLVDSKDAIIHDGIKGKIVFDHLSFSYPGSNKEILKDISFEIQPGTMVGILGRTGSGKSTLVSLLAKLYPVKEGSLYIDDTDINLWRKGDLRNSLGFVAQNSYLFSGTVKDSIAFSQDDTSSNDDEKIIQASKFASVHEDILGFENGYESLVGEKGGSVSGGQRQRISIARAIYKNPDLLVLDDSLSAVDADTELRILSNIKNERKTTTIVIAHRISALEECDRILVLDEGRLVGNGTHEELLKNCRIYYDIAKMQELEKEVN